MKNHKTLTILAQIIFINSYAIANDTINKNEFFIIKQEMFSTTGQCEINKLIKSTKTLSVSNKFTIDDNTFILKKSANKNILCLISMSSTPKFIIKNKNREIEYSAWTKSNTEAQKITFLLSKHIQEACNSSPVLIEFYKKNDKLIRNIDISTTDLDCAIELTKKSLTKSE
ncbi:hypothetical protein [Vogesella sp. LIG4]|uniref:hypothetical protein n=1 Tax=Vogesella sp. LIG4 TaxID=1192162 RepID=UPI0012FDAFA3|nr:hypothetical protein [Vogesella sp. LIG4]